MFRATAVALAALAAFDYLYFDSWYAHAVEAVMRDALHFIAG